MEKAFRSTVAAALAALFTNMAPAATFTVNQTGDQSDASAVDGVADVDLVAPGLQTTLRAAIEEANRQVGTDTVTFTGGITALTVNSLPGITGSLILQSPNEDVPVEIRIMSGASLLLFSIPVGSSTLKGIALPGGLQLSTLGTNTVTKCLIGCDRLGATAGNANGLLISNSGGNTMTSCIISGSNSGGVSISGATATGNQFVMCRVGTNKEGTAALQNNGAGIVIDNVSGTMITNCVVSGNKTFGINVKNTGATGTVIADCRIGTNEAGAAALPNLSSGVAIENASSVTIRDCVISGNTGNGVQVTHTTQATNILIEDNLIGVAMSGTTALGNSQTGVNLSNSNGTVVRRNTISGNLGTGIFIGGNSPGNTITKNMIGTDSAGTTALGNGGDGVAVFAAGVTVGDLTGADGNVISGNLNDGVELNGAPNSIVAGNKIGTDAAGTKALGNALVGVRVDDSSGVLVKKNVISANDSGVALTGSIGTPVTDVRVEDNFIGTGEGGAPALGNAHSGVFFLGANNCTIGGPNVGNVIAYNGSDGIFVFGFDDVGNAFLGNSIHDNKQSGIQLGFDFEDANHNREKPKPNDQDDTDTGSNNSQNYPVLFSEGGIPMGRLNSTPNTNFRIEFFGNAALDASKHGEGAAFLGFIGVTTDANGDVEFNVPGAAKGSQITATATEIVGGVPRSTSEFSRGIAAVDDAGIFVVNSTGDAGDINPGDGFAWTGNETAGGNPEVTLRAAMQEAEKRKKNKTKPVKIHFNLPGAGPFAIQPATFLPPTFLPLTIDGSTQPGAGPDPLVEIDGRNTAPNAFGIGGKGVTIKTLSIHSFTGTAITIGGNGAAVIQGNLIGQRPPNGGTPGAIPGNGGDGIFIVEADANQIGGADPGAGNTIAGNRGCGVVMTQGSNRNFVRGNTIMGSGAVNPGTLSGHGIRLDLRSTRNVIGGTVAGAGNVIVGNNANGIFIATEADGTQIQGNYIGVKSDGVTAMGNLKAGIYIQNSSKHLIGGPLAGARNVISGNENGIEFFQALDSDVQGNFIGTDATGAEALPNTEAGIDITAGFDLLIGGPKPGAGNVIAGNGFTGIVIKANGDQVSARNTIQGNLIGTDVTGTTPIPHNDTGIGVHSAEKTLIGGPKAGMGNVIGGNFRHGIVLTGTVALPCKNTVIQGNFIGTNPDGTETTPNVLDGIFISEAIDTLIGGTKAGMGNAIGRNGGAGISFQRTPCTRNIVQGNLIGLLINGAAKGNLGPGVAFGGTEPTGNIIGGTAKGAGNLIAFNGDGPTKFPGVSLRNANPLNAVVGNTIHSNGALGIDLGAAGVTANSAGDNIVNFPIIETASVSGATTRITGHVDALVPEKQHIVQFFGNDAADGSGHGEGQHLLGSVKVKSAKVTGFLGFTATARGQFASITATVTQLDDKGVPLSSSEFAQNIVPTVAIPPELAARAGNSPVSFSDADGDHVTARVKGGGVLTFSGGDLSIRGTTAKTRLSIRVARGEGSNGFANLGGISVRGDLASLDAPHADIAGLSVTGWLGNLNIHDLLGGGGIFAGGDPTQRTSIRASVIGEGTTINLGSGIRNFTAEQLGHSEFAAPSLGAMRITGGDFSANMTLTGEGVPEDALALRWLSVNGVILRSVIQVDGKIGVVSARETIDSTIGDR